MERIWLRLGGFITADDDTIERIKAGDEQALIEAITDHGFEVEGDTYIPDEETGDEIEFDLDSITLARNL